MEVIINGCNVIIDNVEDIIFHKKRLYQSIVNLKQELSEKEEELKKVEKYLSIHCEHEWVTDSIDSMKNYKLAQPIKYCEICELSR
jgi:hypothetical protein